MNVTEYIMFKSLSGGASTSEYDPAKKYAPGDYAIHDGKLYICTREATGDWDDDCWVDATSMSDVVGQLNKTQGMIAATFDQGVIYSAGAYVIYEDELYRFTREHSGTWNNTDVEKTELSEALCELKTELTDHANNSEIHVTAEEKARWNNKVSVSYEDGTLIFSK